MREKPCRYMACSANRAQLCSAVWAGQQHYRLKPVRYISICIKIYIYTCRNNFFHHGNVNCFTKRWQQNKEQQKMCWCEFVLHAILTVLTVKSTVEANRLASRPRTSEVKMTMKSWVWPQTDRQTHTHVIHGHTLIPMRAITITRSNCNFFFFIVIYLLVALAPSHRRTVVARWHLLLIPLSNSSTFLFSPIYHPWPRPLDQIWNI